MLRACHLPCRERPPMIALQMPDRGRRLRGVVDTVQDVSTCPHRRSIIIGSAGEKFPCRGCGSVFERSNNRQFCAACACLPNVRNHLTISELESVIESFHRIGIDTLKPQDLLMSTAISNIQTRSANIVPSSSCQQILPTVLNALGISDLLWNHLQQLRAQGRQDEFIHLCIKNRLGWAACFFIDSPTTAENLRVLSIAMEQERVDRWSVRWSQRTRDNVMAHLLPLRITCASTQQATQRSRMSKHLLGQSSLQSVRSKYNTTRYLEMVDIDGNLPLELGKLVIVHEMTHIALWLDEPYHPCGQSSILEEAVCHIVSVLYLERRMREAHTSLTRQERLILNRWAAVCREKIFEACVPSWDNLMRHKGWKALKAAFFMSVV
eukprot:Blabericola_migrator_1__3955@NODE_21_length_22536_cov_99_458098_g18_i0_p8_GENE_NODE_21_length_22536_cov_99_458098_g18_i0NODE_21_length_22536_cov_99_458098_g18_i0_p8_ORF_typecomplete_len380_score31_04DA1like/PF12315_8/7_7e06_NODE_21_length_22536_cov_99_458098_g18_i0944010579